jgi:DNA polymerase I-like protein with 3'-5' exonuclease and polymerase domains
LQNIPRDAEIRSIFQAEEGNTLVGADYSQVELRVAAELSRDPEMLNVYCKGIDLHAFMASKIAGKPLDKVTKEERQLGKALNFGLAFGLGAKGLVDYARWNYGVSLTEDEAYSHVRAFFDTYSGYADWQRVQRDIAAKTMHTTSTLGKLRKLQPLGMYTRSVNHPIQSTSAEVVITALNMLQKKIDNKTIRLLLSVHDELILEVEAPKVKEAKELLGKTMTEAYLKLFPCGVIKNLVDVKSGKTWRDTK